MKGFLLFVLMGVFAMTAFAADWQCVVQEWR